MSVVMHYDPTDPVVIDCRESESNRILFDIVDAWRRVNRYRDENHAKMLREVEERQQALWRELERGRVYLEGIQML